MLAQLRHLFIPHHTNNHRPKILHPSGLALLIGIYLFSQASLKLVAHYDQQFIQGEVLGYASNISVGDVIAQVNQERLNNGKATLIENGQLAAAAQAKANDMFASNYWAHNNPTNGRQPWNFIREAGYVYRYAGENLARDFGDTPSMVAAWMASPTHRDNIVSDRYTETGVAVANGSLEGVETTLVVQMFGNRSGKPAVSAATTSTLPQSVPSKKVSSPSPLPSSLEPSPTPPSVLSEIPLPKVAVVQASEPNTNSVIPPMAISKSLALSIIFVLGATLCIDYIIISKRKIVRLTGKNTAHLAFLSVVAIIILVIQAGNIL